jgi:hypothetical protein
MEWFDRWRRSNRPVCKDTGISWQDYGGMHTFERPTSRRISKAPPWAMNDASVRIVVGKYIANLLIGESNPPVDLDGLRAMSDRAMAWLLSSDAEVYHTLYDSAKRAGGLAQYLVWLIYVSYRRGLNSVKVAEELGIKPTNARQTLHRLNKIARETFGDEACAPRRKKTK